MYGQAVNRWHSRDNGHEGWLEMRRLMHLIGRDPDTPPPTRYDIGLHHDFHASLMGSPAECVITSFPSLVATDHVWNTPGKGFGCWTTRVKQRLGDYRNDAFVGPWLGAFPQLVRDTGRWVFD